MRDRICLQPVAEKPFVLVYQHLIKRRVYRDPCIFMEDVCPLVVQLLEPRSDPEA